MSPELPTITSGNAAPFGLRVSHEPGLADAQLAGPWDLDCLAHHPGRQALLCRDARWDAELVCAWDADQLVGCAVLARPTGTLSDPELRRAVELLVPQPVDLTRLMFLGSPVEYASGVAVTRDLRFEPAEVSRAIVAAAARAAQRRQLSLGTVFAGSTLTEQLAETAWPPAGASRPGLVDRQATAVPLTQRAAIVGPFADFEQYLGAQSGSRRAMIRRELRAISHLGLEASVVDLDTAFAAGACELISELKVRHGLPEAPRLVRLRVQRWARSTAGMVRAILVRAGERLVAVALTLQCDRHHEVYEVGLSEDFPDRIHAYALACFYEPVRLLVEQGGTALDLGVGTTEAKQLRGATLEPSYGYFLLADQPS